MIPPVLKNLTHIDFIVTDIFQLDKVIQDYGKIIYYTPEVVFGIPNIDKDLYLITNLEMTTEKGENLYIIQRDPNSIGKLKNPKTDYDYKIAVTDYDLFSENFDLESLPSFMDEMNEKYHPECIESLKLELVNSKTETACKILYQDLLLHIEVSNEFLKGNIYFGTILSQEVQKAVCYWLLKYNEYLLSHVQQYFKTIFPNDNKPIEENVIQIVANKADAEKEKLRNSNVYRIALLFADGVISFEKMTAMYGNKQYNTINELAEIISQDHKISKTSLQPYLNQTIKEVNSDKNLFDISKLKYLQLIAEDFHSQQKQLSPFFSGKIEKLTSINE
ncbi:hypothetical protein [Chryseobacterium aquaticum]|uniref:hypothetical protein n=1 Tax=Chryseobacterium aquaticum TaxID=452084 RepID=UPI002FC95058